MNILNDLNKENLHHAYLIEGDREEIIPELFVFIESLGVKTLSNPDFCHITVDTFKIDDAKNLKSLQSEKTFSPGKKVFIISANNFLIEAQNTLLKIFEEPIENTHFFLIVPNAQNILKTLVSRFYLIQTKAKLKEEIINAEKFIKMSYKNRIDFIKEILTDDDEVSSAKMKASRFLDAIEFVIHQKIILKEYKISELDFFNQIFKVREFINQPGSSMKSLMESIALSVPILKF